MDLRDELLYETRASSVKQMAKHVYDKYMRLNTYTLGLSDVVEAMFPHVPDTVKLEMMDLIEEMYIKDRSLLH